MAPSNYTIPQVLAEEVYYILNGKNRKHFKCIVIINLLVMLELRRQEIEQQKLCEKLKDPNAGKTADELIMERVDHCKELQHVKGEPLFGVLYSTIHKAAQDGNCAGITFFIQSGGGRGQLRKARVDDYDKNSICPIHYAAERGHNHVADMLVDKGCDVNVESGDKMTAMMYAAKGGWVHTVEHLYELGGNLYMKNRAGMTAAHFAAQGNHSEVIACLQKLSKLDRTKRLEEAHFWEAKRLAELEALQDGEKSPVVAAPDDMSSSSKKGKDKKAAASPSKAADVVHETVEDITKEPCNRVIDTPSRNGNRPLHMATNSNSLQTMEVLISLGVEIDAVDNVGETALHKAARKNYILAYDLLVDHDADEEKKNQLRETPIQLVKDDVCY